MSASTYAPLGIDISKKTFDVALLKGKKRTKTAKFDNTPAGFEKLGQWLKAQGMEKVHGCLEAANIYGYALAAYLYHQGHQVSIVNPARIKGMPKAN
ncbi:MAG: transposase [Pseudanabaenales cyanobacterium]|nr:transposase [Pseudanabaenales cyanobacterium]